MEVIKFLQSFSNGFLDVFFQLVTMIGEEYFYVSVLAIIFWCVNKKWGYKLGFIILSNGIVNNFLKECFNAPRPIGVKGIRSLRVETATGSSFPSGHTEGTAAFWTAIMNRYRKVWLYIIGIIIIILVGTSRLYLGVHWPKDVIAGLIIGVIWSFIVGELFDYSEYTGNKLLLFIIILPSILGLIWFHSDDYIKAVGMSLGFYVGYIVETSYIDFYERATLWKQVLKLIIGIAVLVAIKSGLKLVLPSTGFYDFIRYVLIGLWATAGAPYVFNKFLQGNRTSRVFRNLK